MRRGIRTGAAALALLLSLTACSAPAGTEEFKADAYVTGVLNELYLGQFDPEYLDMVGISEEQAQQAYENGLDQEAAYFIAVYSIQYPTDELREDLAGLYKEIYQHTEFQVEPAVEQEDGSYSVEVKIRPIDIVQQVEGDEATQEAYKAFGEKYPVEKLNAMDAEEYEAADREYAEMLLKLYQDKLPETGNQDEVSVTVRLEKNENGYYAIPAEDFTRLNDAIIDYHGSGSDGIDSE